MRSTDVLRSPSRGLALEARGVHVSYAIRRNLIGRVSERFHAVDGVDVEVSSASTLGVLGESGSGKSTLARAIGWLVPPDSGSVRIDGKEIEPGDNPRWVRQAVQYVFQDPYGSLDPTKTVGRSTIEPLVVFRWGDRDSRHRRMLELFELVGLNASLASHRPAELSGGQRQRVAIARALASTPKVVIADEPTSALDVSTRSEILNLFSDIQDELGTAFVFISHDVGTARHISKRIAVMYKGRVVEEGDADVVVDHPAHPYTQALLSAVLVADPRIQQSRRRIPLTTTLSSSVSATEGCPYVSRCHIALPECATVEVRLRAVDEGHRVACIAVAD